METFWEDLKSGRFADLVKENTKGKKIMNSREAFHIMRPLCAKHPDVEKVHCIFVNAKNRGIDIKEMFFDRGCRASFKAVYNICQTRR